MSLPVFAVRYQLCLSILNSHEEQSPLSDSYRGFSMSNEYIFFIGTLFLCIVLYKIIIIAHKRNSDEANDEQRSGDDRRQSAMYRIPERRSHVDSENEQDRRGLTAGLVPGMNTRRSGNDRRKGGSRRQWQLFKIPENRKLGNRRDGIDRRKLDNSIDPVVA